jgi:CBS domain-containing protein
MMILRHPHLSTRLVLDACTAEELMTTNPVSLPQSTTLRDAAAFLAGRGISAAPVIDEAGRPLGVVSRTDLLIQDEARAELRVEEADESSAVIRTSNLGALTDEAVVGDVMTPRVFSVATDTVAEAVVARMLGLGVRRVFVVDEDGILVGVISAVDVLRHLRRLNGVGLGKSVRSIRGGVDAC